MKHYLVRFDSNWADEFDVSGFSVFNQDEIDVLNNFLAYIKYNESPSIYFGTNEGFEEGEISEGDFVVIELTDEECKVIVNTFNYDYGLLTPKEILNNWLEFIEEEDEQE